MLKNTDTLGIQGLGEACEGNERRRIYVPSMALCGVCARACVQRAKAREAARLG